MKRLRQDPLLGSVRLLLTALLGLAVLVATGGIAASIIFAVRNGEFGARMAAQGMAAPDAWWVAGLGLLVTAMAVLAFFFVRNLRRIVDSVADGDPFVPINAGRLRAMGWLALAFQAVAVPMTDVAVWFDAAPHKPNVHLGTDGLSLGALLLTLVLFILARVFRQGAAMREELEGTV